MDARSMLSVIKEEKEFELQGRTYSLSKGGWYAVVAYDSNGKKVGSYNERSKTYKDMFKKGKESYFAPAMLNLIKDSLEEGAKILGFTLEVIEKK